MMETQSNVKGSRDTESKETTFGEGLMSSGAEIYAKTQETANEAYEKSAKIAGDAYNQARSFSRDNPEKIAILAFGIGLGLGILMCSRQSHTSRASNVADALYDALRRYYAKAVPE